MKIKLTEYQFKNVILNNDDDISVNASDGYIEIIKGGISYLYQLQAYVGKFLGWKDIKVTLINMKDKILKFIYPITDQEMMREISEEDINKIKSLVGNKLISGLKTKDGKDLQLVLIS